MKSSEMQKAKTWASKYPNMLLVAWPAEIDFIDVLRLIPEARDTIRNLPVKICGVVFVYAGMISNSESECYKMFRNMTIGNFRVKLEE